MVKELDYKKYEVGNYFIEKVKVDYTEELGKSMSDCGIPGLIKDCAEKEGYVPYIVFGDKAGMVSVRWIAGSALYNFFDTLETENGDITEKEMKFLDVWVNILFNTISFVGDNEYWKGMIKCQTELLNRIITDASQGSPAEK